MYHLNKAQEIIERISDQEDDSLANMPENLQSAERCEKMENAVDKLNDASTTIDEAKECVESAMR